MRINRLFSTAIAVCFSVVAQAQVVSVSESFDATAFAPAGWAIKADLGNQNIWVRRTNGTNGTQVVCNTHSGAGLARFTSRTVAAGTTQLLITPVVDYSNRGSNAANFSLWMFRDSLMATNPDSLCIYVNTTDTLSASAVKLGTIARNRSVSLPDTQSVNGWYQYTFAVPATFNTGINYFILEGHAETQTAGSGANIFVDDINYDTYPVVCSGTPNAGAVLSNASILCGGSGSAALSLSNTLSGLGITYDWQSAASASGPWTSLGQNAATATTGTISTTTYYQCIVHCTQSGLSDTTPVYTLAVSTNPVPTISISASSNVVCNGDTAQLIASGATTYTWLPGTSSTTVNGDTAWVAPTAATQYTVTGTDGSGCSATATVNLNVSNGPNVSISANPSDTVCSGQQVILNSIQGGNTNGFTYLWSDGITTRRDTILASATAVYSVLVTNASGCSNSDTITIVVNPATVGNFGYVQNGNTITLTDSTQNSTAWAWDFGDGNQSTNQNPVYTYSTAGNFTITLIVTGPCGNDTVTKAIGIWPESVQSLSLSAIQLYPNPATSNVVISALHSGDLLQEVQLFDMHGRSLWSQKALNSSQFSIQTGHLSKGQYLIKTNLGKQVLTIQ